MISISHKFLFIHLPKTGGNSVQEALKMYSEDEITQNEPRQDGVERFDVINRKYGTTKHTKLYEYQRAIDPKLFRELKKFTIIRNPWDRCVSRYFFSIAADEYSKGLKYEDIAEPVFKKSEFITIVDTTPTVESYIFEESLGKDFNDLKNAGVQYLRFENLQEDFNSLAETLEIQKQKLYTRNKSPHKPYDHYYDDELVELVARKFKSEIELMNYRFSGL